MNFLLVGAGGALGSMLRYAVSLLPFGGTFPIQTLLTNIVGAVAIGFIFETAELKSVSSNTVAFLKTGVCGGFTTFSTFSLEAHELIAGGNAPLGTVYAVLSAGLCILGVAAGMRLAKIACGA